MSKRISNSRSKAKQLETMKLEEQTRKMEDKLSELKKFMELQKEKRDEGKMNESASRWKTSATPASVPLKNYAQKILDEQKEAFKKYGVNTKKILGTKTFKPIVESLKPTKEPEVLTQTQVHPQPLLDIQPHINLGDRFGKAKIALPVIEVEQAEPSSQSRPEVVEVEPEQREVADEADYEQEFEVEEQAESAEHEQGRLQAGEYDQEKNRLQFEAAVLAYRGVYKQIEELAIQTEGGNEKKPNSTEKIVCFSCYRPASGGFTHDDRDFCSVKCRESYVDSITDNCPACHKKFNKFQGICSEGVRYCSPTCSPSAGQMERLFIQWRLEEKQKQKEEGLFDDSLELM